MSEVDGKEEEVNPQKRKALDDVPTEEEEEEQKQEGEEEKLCRFCFDGEEEGGEGKEENKLISPCDCKGGQKYIHLSCLRQWQRMVLVSQPTHPDFWEDDIRHTKCNVCKADFTCKPPTRQELMLGFTGPEIAALIGEGCIIASHDSFNRNIQTQIQDNPLLAHLTSVQHWLRGVYLITSVKEDNGEIEYTLEDSRDVNQLFKRLDCTDIENSPPFLELADGSKYELQTSEGVLAGGRSTLPEMNEKDLRSLLESSLPCHLVFRPSNASSRRRHDCTDDKVRAVNLTRPYEPRGGLQKRAQKIIQETQTESNVDVIYFRGGPCEEDRIVTCLVLGGRRRGYTVVQSFRTALLMAKRNALNALKDGRNNIAVGQHVTIQGLCKRQDLNGRMGFVQAYDVSQERFEVRILQQQSQKQQQQQQEEEDNNDDNNSTNTDHDDKKSTNNTNGNDNNNKKESNAAAAAPPQPVDNNTTNSNSNSNQPPQSQSQVVVKVKPTNLQSHTHFDDDDASNAPPIGIGGGAANNNKGTVLAFVGDARWTRVQLLGEIAKTSWGLCHAQIEDLLLAKAPKLYDAVHPRLLYAPESEMSRDEENNEETNRNDMILLRRVVLNAQEQDDDNEDEDDDDEEEEGGRTGDEGGGE